MTSQKKVLDTFDHPGVRQTYRIGMLVEAKSKMQVDMLRGMRLNMFLDMCLDMCVDMFLDMCSDMCLDMCLHK